MRRGSSQDVAELHPRRSPQTDGLEGFVGRPDQLGPGEVGLAIEFDDHGMELGEVAQHVLLARHGVLATEFT